MISSIPQKQPPARMAVSCIGALNQTRIHERFEILAIAGLVHVLQWDEFERRRVDAIAQATFIGRSVIEYVAEMRIRRLRADFRPNHAQGRVLFLYDVGAFDRLSEARPTCAGVELVERTEQRLFRHHVHIQARLMVVPISIAKRRLSAALLSDGELFGGQFPFQFCFTRFFELVHAGSDISRNISVLSPPFSHF